MWKLGGIRIYVEEDTGWQVEPRKGTVELLDTNYSIVHTAGRKSMMRDITFVVFSGYYSDIVPLIDDTTTTFEDYDGTVDTVTIMGKPSATRIYNYRDSTDGTKVFRVKMNLLKDES